MVNRRYARQIDERVAARTDEIIMRDYPPQSLKTRELELDSLPQTVTPIPYPVLAWVHFGNIPLKVEAEAVTWTPRAVGIRFKTPQGRRAPHLGMGLRGRKVVATFSLLGLR